MELEKSQSQPYLSNKSIHLYSSEVQKSTNSNIQGSQVLENNMSSSLSKSNSFLTTRISYMEPPSMTYHLEKPTKRMRKKGNPLSISQVSLNSQTSVSVYPPQSETDSYYFDQAILDNLSLSSSQREMMLKNSSNGLYYEELEKIRRFKGLNNDYFENVILNDIKQTKNVPEENKDTVTNFYYSLCVFSARNVLFYKRLFKHEQQFGLEHGDPQKNVHNDPDEHLPRLKELLEGHLKVGPGIQNIRSFYNNKQIIKDQYSTLLHSILRVIFSKVRDYVIELYPNLSWLMGTIKPGTARFNYSNAVSLALLHADKQFSPQMLACFIKIAKVVFYIGGIQDIKLQEVQALFELLRQRNEQHLVPMKLSNQTQRRSSEGKKRASKNFSMVPYVPYCEPEFDVDFQVPRPSKEQVFERCGPYVTRNWTSKYERYVLALYMQHQNFFQLRQILNQDYEAYIGREIDLEELRLKFDNTMKKLVIYLQLELYYIIRRTNIAHLHNYKIDFPTKKFLTLNKCEKRTLFSSENSRNCRMFIIDYYLNNYLRKGKSYKMSAINYRLSYLCLAIDSIMLFLSSKIGESGILIETDLEKEDTYPLKLVNNAYFSIIKSVIKEILTQKALKTNDKTQKMIKNPNTKRSLVTADEVQKVFHDLKPDDVMEIQELYMQERNKSLIVKRNPKMFPNFKITPALQVGFVQNEWEKLTKIIDRVGTDDIEEEQDQRGEKFEIAENFGMGVEDIFNDATSSKSKKSNSKSQQKNGQKVKELGGEKSQGGQTVDEETEKKWKEDFITAMKESTFIKTELLILKMNYEKNNFKKYFK